MVADDGLSFAIPTASAPDGSSPPVDHTVVLDLPKDVQWGWEGKNWFCLSALSKTWSWLAIQTGLEERPRRSLQVQDDSSSGENADGVA